MNYSITAVVTYNNNTPNPATSSPVLLSVADPSAFSLAITCSPSTGTVNQTMTVNFTVTATPLNGGTLPTLATVCVPVLNSTTSCTSLQIPLTGGHGSASAQIGNTSPVIYNCSASAFSTDGGGNSVKIDATTPAVVTITQPGIVNPAVQPNIPMVDCPVNLVTGDESHTPGPDLVVYNPTGPAASFTREFLNTQSKFGYGSPGLAPGWVHAYDVYIDATMPAPGARWRCIIRTARKMP